MKSEACAGRLRLLWIALPAVFLAFSAQSLAQSGLLQGGDLAGSMSPELGHARVRVDFQGAWFPTESVQGQPTNLSYSQQNLTVAFPVLQDSTDEWAANAHARGELFTTDAILPNTHQPFPDELWNIRMGTSYRHLFDNGWISGVSLNFGSASDKPFHSIHEMTAGASAFLRVPQGEHNAWLFTLNYSTNSEFLNGIPIPGVAYLWEPNDWFRAVVGFPFTSVTVKPIEDLTFDLTYAPISHVRTKISYRVCKPVKIFAAFDIGEESYYLADRIDERQRFFYYDKRATFGITMSPNRQVQFELSGGYSFDRFYFEGRNYNDRSFNRIDISDGPFAAFRVDIRF